MKGLPNLNHEQCASCKKIPSRISTIMIKTGTITKTFYSCIAHPQKVMLIAQRGMA